MCEPALEGSYGEYVNPAVLGWCEDLPITVLDGEGPGTDASETPEPEKVSVEVKSGVLVIGDTVYPPGTAPVTRRPSGLGWF